MRELPMSLTPALRVALTAVTALARRPRDGPAHQARSQGTRLRAGCPTGRPAGPRPSSRRCPRARGPGLGHRLLAPAVGSETLQPATPPRRSLEPTPPPNCLTPQAARGPQGSSRPPPRPGQQGPGLAAPAPGGPVLHAHSLLADPPTRPRPARTRPPGRSAPQLPLPREERDPAVTQAALAARPGLQHLGGRRRGFMICEEPADSPAQPRDCSRHRRLRGPLRLPSLQVTERVVLTSGPAPRPPRPPEGPGMRPSLPRARGPGAEKQVRASRSRAGWFPSSPRTPGSGLPYKGSLETSGLPTHLHSRAGVKGKAKPGYRARPRFKRMNREKARNNPPAGSRSTVHQSQQDSNPDAHQPTETYATRPLTRGKAGQPQEGIGWWTCPATWKQQAQQESDTKATGLMMPFARAAQSGPQTREADSDRPKECSGLFCLGWP
ncbi:basic proline-rich protein-like [Perognathus longimembris pacificus]|uniref:basic proline-rich protein-like n=1 Tax=Perognathus longimembris pacificus TaxID=214514 RepID=UPI0020193F33|nr:basic proline-rich protein-like [Perognathus longimembris pacificus]